MPIASMTGFARESGVTAGFSWTIELKSVNGRGLDLRFRLAPPFDSLEPDLRGCAQRRLTRGSVQIAVAAKRDTTTTAVRLNEDMFLKYAEAAEKMAWAANLAAPTMGDILRMPGVIDTGEGAGDALSEEAQTAFIADFDRALQKLKQARQSEGAALTGVLTKVLDDMSGRIEAAAAADLARADGIAARLKSQLEALTQAATFDSQRLHQEAALIATRIDVREEIDRLRAHVDQARGLLAGGDAVGRKLDFLAQEFVRETNTLCSKANDLALTRIGLDLKALVEQFREQVQNIE